MLPLVSLAHGLPHTAGRAEPELRRRSRHVAAHGAGSARRALGTADAIHAITGRGHTITFAIDRGGEAFESIATTRGHGKVVALYDRRDVGPAIGDLGGLSWLSSELTEATAITA